MRDRALVRWIAKTAGNCKRVCSVCIGSFLLAEAGILNGRRAATHWLHTGLLASRYPSVTVEPDSIFVRDGRVWTSAGVTSGIDLALARIEQDISRKVAIEVARSDLANNFVVGRVHQIDDLRSMGSDELAVDIRAIKGSYWSRGFTSFHLCRPLCFLQKRGTYQKPTSTVRPTVRG